MNHLTTSKVVAYLAVIFLAGGVAGAVITRKNVPAREAQPPSMEKVCHRLQDRLISTLGLSEAQVKKLQPIFEQTAQELRSIHSKAIGDSEEIICKAHQQIAKELTPEQQTKLTKLDQERREWLRHRLKDPAEREVQ